MSVVPVTAASPALISRAHAAARRALDALTHGDWWSLAQPAWGVVLDATEESVHLLSELCDTGAPHEVLIDVRHALEQMQGAQQSVDSVDPERPVNPALIPTRPYRRAIQLLAGIEHRLSMIPVED